MWDQWKAVALRGRGLDVTAGGGGESEEEEEKAVCEVGRNSQSRLEVHKGELGPVLLV